MGESETPVAWKRADPPIPIGRSFLCVSYSAKFAEILKRPRGWSLNWERAYRSTSENPLGGRATTYPSTLGALAGVFLAYALHFHSVGIERVACAVTSSQLRLLLGWVFRNLTGER